MKEIKYNNLEEKVYYDKLENGLELYFYPNKKAKNFYITLNVDFGSVITDFKPKNSKKYYHVPNGTAHFLEHIMFYEPDNHTAHERFALLGSSCNAATSFRNTYYEVMGTSRFQENLEYLFTYVYRFCGNEKNVISEKKIIIEEIKQGQTNPYRNLYFESKKSLYQKSNYSKEISGSEKDVESISLEDLKICYESFYHPENMYLIITGNFNPYEARAIVSEMELNKQKKIYQKPKIKSIIEPLKVNKEIDFKEMNVEVSKVSYNIKLLRNNFKIKDDFILTMYIYIFLFTKLGKTSLIKELLLENNLISNGPNISVNICDDILAIEIIFDSKHPDEALKIIKSCFQNKKITIRDLKIRKRVEISNLILSFDDIFNVGDNIQQQLVLYNKIYYDSYNIINNLSLKEINIVTENINLENTSTYIIRPIKKDC